MPTIAPRCVEKPLTISLRGDDMDAGTSKGTPFEYKVPFEQERDEILRTIVRWQIEHGSLSGLSLDNFESLVLIKNIQLVVMLENANFKRYVALGKSTEGLQTEQIFSPHVNHVYQLSDQLILDGAISLQVEHLSPWESNRTVTMVTYMKRLEDLKNPACAIIAISRAKDFVRSIGIERRLSLNEALVLLQKLDDKDRTICNSLYDGDTTKETADSLGMTSRAVELRRQRILDLLGFERPIEIVKLLVRLEENGLLNGKL